MKREVRVEDAVGMRLAHDFTRIVPGEFKGPAFRLGHVIQAEDIPLLLDIGKRHIYVLELEPGELHENDGAVRMAGALSGPGITYGDPHEGKVIFKARHNGVLQVDEDRLFAVNQIPDISVATKRPWQAVTAGASVAAARPIPLIIDAAKIESVERIGANGGPVVDVLPYKPQRAFLVTTGSEIQTGRIDDRFGPVLRQKFAAYEVPLIGQVMTGDEQGDIIEAISRGQDAGATIVCVTGGMSVDPDDRSPGAIRAAADAVVSYGTPMLPGSMMMLAYLGETAVFGLPGAVIYDEVTSFDVLLPRILAGVRVTKDDIARLGAGGWLHA
jgi:molybdopterin biosynthesis enzyme MoaB